MSRCTSRYITTLCNNKSADFSNYKLDKAVFS